MGNNEDERYLTFTLRHTNYNCRAANHEANIDIEYRITIISYILHKILPKIGANV